jgi:hypothetical protein
LEKWNRTGLLCNAEPTAASSFPMLFKFAEAFSKADLADKYSSTALAMMISPLIEIAILPQPQRARRITLPLTPAADRRSLHDGARNT